jgi:Mn-dependent DtxR family transcriptional regulator
MPQWSVLSNHGAVLAVIAQQKAIKAVDIAALLELTERSVRRIIADLYKDGYITKKYEGGVNHYKIETQKTLRRKAQQNVTIRELLKALGLNVDEEE